MDFFTKDIARLIFEKIDNSKTWIALSKANILANNVSKELLILEEESSIPVVCYETDVINNILLWKTKLPSGKYHGLYVACTVDKNNIIKHLSITYRNSHSFLDNFLFLRKGKTVQQIELTFSNIPSDHGGSHKMLHVKWESSNSETSTNNDSNNQMERKFYLWGPQ
jgi:hypothetical protein